jgi:hypothetical protein
VTGNVRPRVPGVVINLEKLVGKEWQAVDVIATTDEQGNFAMSVPAQSRGVITLRATIAQDANWTALASPTFNIIIR